MDERTRTEQDGVSITEELREYVYQKDGWGMTHTLAKAIAAIADRIDERYHRDMATAQQVGINEGEDAAMREGWVRLPVDADGEVIHIGDVMVKPDGWDSGLFSVDSMTLCGDQWSVQGFAPHKLSHHHAPTVEDVLREMVAAYMDTPLDDSNDGEFFAEYAAKLRLAGDAK